ncbi:hypothetical protein FSARC_3061 [Fusarium sarcochroum]|uniref:Zn(2)-C6 fungal-type domain-containing protein n=1 Tax=Fusarium sarcochroum TaxID=1208366 RepID=A0A8H4XD45_9HYPO|nr:hypothetical protein FSARC_3061 [Fusarium sarcochroum]
MVGVPRSTGCQLCRTRKVKCDAQKPFCGNCIKYGAKTCRFDRGLKFITEKHQIRQRGKRSGTGVETLDLSSSSSTAGSDGLDSVAATESGTSLSLVNTSPTLLKLELPRAQFLLNMIETSSVYAQSTDVFNILSWLSIDRLGKRALLDGAVSSFVLHLTGKERSDTDLIAQSRTMYGLTLNELQSTLQHSSEWKASETLCAAIILCYFELFAGTSAPDTWMEHTKGIGTLIQQRGPAAHAEGWDAAMLLSFRGIIIIGDMFYPSKDQLFLLRPAWKQVMFDRGRRLIYAADTPIEHTRIGDDFCANLAQLSPILHWGYLVREANKAGISVEPDKVSALAHLAAVNHARLARWYDDFTALQFPQPVEAVSTDPVASPFETVLEHESPAAGSLLMGYWASRLILEETLVQCGTPLANSEASIRHLVEQILRSIESVGRGTMGPYRIGFAVRIVYEFATGEEQRWITSMLDKFSGRYAAIDKSTYPQPKDDDIQPVRMTIQPAALG